MVGFEASQEALRSAATVDDRATLLRSIAERAGFLTALGKEKALGAVVAGGPLSDEQRLLASEIGASLGMTPAHVQGVLSEAR